MANTDTEPIAVSWAEVRAGCLDIAHTAIESRRRYVYGSSDDGQFVAIVVREIANLRYGKDLRLLTPAEVDADPTNWTPDVLVVDVVPTPRLDRFAALGMMAATMYPAGHEHGRLPWQHDPAPIDALIAIAEWMDPTCDGPRIARQVHGWLDARGPDDRARILRQLEGVVVR